MRTLFALFVVPLLAMSAQAQTMATGATTADPAATTTSGNSTATKPTHTRLTMEQHFQQANITHDGHLTQDQAKTGYKTIARHFAAIDQDKKGYITEEDIHAYYKTQRALHHQTAATNHATNNQSVSPLTGNTH